MLLELLKSKFELGGLVPAKQPSTVDGVLGSFSKMVDELHEVYGDHANHAAEKLAQAQKLEKEADDHRNEMDRAHVAINAFEDFFNTLPKSTLQNSNTH